MIGTGLNDDEPVAECAFLGIEIPPEEGSEDEFNDLFISFIIALGPVGVVGLRGTVGGGSTGLLSNFGESGLT